MSKKKSSDHKSSGHAKPPAIPGTSHAFNNDNDASLSGMEDIAHGLSAGVPFILVDGVAVATRTRLDKSLARQEGERMTKAMRECEHLIQLESIVPPPELDATFTGTPATAAAAMASLKAIEDELKFQNDMQDLCLPMLLLEYKNELVSDSEAPTVHSSNNEISETSVSKTADAQNLTLGQTTSNLDHIRSKLEELRHQQEKMLQVSSGFSERPSIRRQATFDIKRVSNDVHREGLDGPLSLQIPMQQSNKSPKSGDSASTSKFSKIPLYHTDSKLTSHVPPEQTNTCPKDLESCHIINQIGDLIMQYQQKQRHLQNFGKKPTYSYLVTINPEAAVNKCILRPIDNPNSLIEKEQNLLLTESRSNVTIAMPALGNPTINIFSPRSTNRFDTTNPSLRSLKTEAIENERNTKKLPRLSAQSKRNCSGIMLGLLDIPRTSPTLKGIQRRSRASNNPQY
ncbi:uncharacterized protein LOC111519429 [Drosophila willistoni]|uniref:uncharacterized protein LOC111519429 n=1 Tax=Drosophila willistoni TaxID=7260 RepID=UPI00017D92E8|nr:uncharacterized protein LOC111519429 [Drosophila willistoni]